MSGTSGGIPGAAATRVSTAKALASLTAPEVNYEPPKDPAARKKGAVIGAAPVLNPEGLLAAAHIAQEKELLRKQQVGLLLPFFWGWMEEGTWVDNRLC
jgi:hypothetical protein